MPKFAPTDYIQSYYEKSLTKAQEFPREYSFYQSFLSYITGETVLNIGCGPMFFEDLWHFGEIPKKYIGIDINSNTFDYLKNSSHPRLKESKEYAKKHDISTEFIDGSVFDWAQDTKIIFDSIFGVGVFATFSNSNLTKLMNSLWEIMKPGGYLVNVSWDGDYYSEKQYQDKLEYRFSGIEGPTPDQLIICVENCGFKLVERRILMTDPKAYRWDSIHVSAFQRQPQ